MIRRTWRRWSRTVSLSPRTRSLTRLSARPLTRLTFCFPRHCLALLCVPVLVIRRLTLVWLVIFTSTRSTTLCGVRRLLLVGLALLSPRWTAVMATTALTLLLVKTPLLRWSTVIFGTMRLPAGPSFTTLMKIRLSGSRSVSPVPTWSSRTLALLSTLSASTVSSTSTP